VRILCEDAVVPDEVALRDDLAAAAIALEDTSDQRTLRYLTQFLGGLARSVNDTPLSREMDRLAQLQVNGDAVQGQVARIAAMVKERIARTAAI
jgi:hypothetical protein